MIKTVTVYTVYVGSEISFMKSKFLSRARSYNYNSLRLDGSIRAFVLIARPGPKVNQALEVNHAQFEDH